MAIETIIHEDDGHWYFWDETWADRYGPYDTREIAESVHERYCRDVLLLPNCDQSVIDRYTIKPE